jgi:hypothetical protein
LAVDILGVGNLDVNNGSPLPGLAAAAPLAAPLDSTGSAPPSHGLMWFRDTCSMNEVPYLQSRTNCHNCTKWP